MALALAALYLIWGSTYLAIRVAIDGIPPLLMAGFRNVVAGAALYLYLRVTRVPRPTPGQWRGAAVTGILLLAGGNGGVTVAEQWVSSGLASLMVSTVPLWTVLFGILWGARSRRLEWGGIALGLAGMALLNLEGDFRARPVGAVILIGAALSWAFGSIWSKRLSLPPGLMSSAAQMLAGGAFLLLLAAIAGERPAAHIPWRSWAAFGYLVLFGSLVGFSCYLYLLRRVSPALATSYAYVNPVVAVLLGIAFMGERLGPAGFLGMAVILSGVVMVVLSHARRATQDRLPA